MHKAVSEPWDRGAWLACLEEASSSSSAPLHDMSKEDRLWLMAARNFPLCDDAVEHPDPLVAGMGKLRLVQVRQNFDGLSVVVTEIAAAFNAAGIRRRRTLGAAALLSVARLALRMGAWQLLGTVLPCAIGLARSAPQSRRLSVATGLVAEWALVCGQPRTACLYASESLYHGSERQRIRGYLGLAHAMAGCWDRARLLCEEAWSAQNLQEEAAAKAPFGALNLIRIESLRTIAEDSPVYLDAARQRFHNSRQRFAQSPSPIPQLHSRLALALATEHCESRKMHEEIHAIQDDLFREGRWRDGELIDRKAGAGKPPCKKRQEIVSSLDAMGNDFELPSPWCIDFWATKLETSPPLRNTDSGLPTVLFCI